MLFAGLFGAFARGDRITGYRVAQAEQNRFCDDALCRKENQLFPVMEKHGITAPPQVMWGVQDEIREWIKATRNALDKNNRKLLVEKPAP